MTVQLLLPQPASAPAPGDIGAYLRQSGWALKTARSDWVEYVRSAGVEPVTIEVPQRSAARDYPRTVALLLGDLARLEERAASAILNDIRATSVDVVRLGIESTSTRDGKISVEAGRRVYEAARDLLLSAACAVIHPRAVFPRRKPELAMDLLQTAKFGQAEFGSFVLTIECKVPPRLLPPSSEYEPDVDAPMERKTSVRLAQALHEAEAAARECAAADEMAPFWRRTQEGVSANLCEAIAAIIEATKADALRTSFAFAPRRPVPTEVPRAVTFTNDMAPLLREAAKTFRDEATYLGIEVSGPVVRLTSEDATSGGDAVIHASLDGRPRMVHVSLDQQAYQVAIGAHRQDAAVRCIGELARHRGSWVLSNPRDFAISSDSEA